MTINDQRRGRLYYNAAPSVTKLQMKPPFDERRARADGIALIIELERNPRSVYRDKMRQALSLWGLEGEELTAAVNVLFNEGLPMMKEGEGPKFKGLFVSLVSGRVRVEVWA